MISARTGPKKVREVRSAYADLEDTYVAFTGILLFLLSFFIYFDTIVTPNAIRRSDVLGSVEKRFVGKMALNRPRVAEAAAERKRNDSSQILAAAAGANFKVSSSNDRYVITLPGARVFESGDDRILADIRAPLERIADLVARLGLRVDIEGHTDNRPISGGRFRSNWELSAARAVSVLRLFTERGIPADRLSASGRGEYVPVADNSSEESRALNRRVVLTVWAGKSNQASLDQGSEVAR